MNPESPEEHVPVRFASTFVGTEDSTFYLTIGMQRSGQHAVIDWICKNLADVIHFNHCRFFENGHYGELAPVTGRRILYHDGIVDDSGIRTREQLNEGLPNRSFKNLLYSVESVDIRTPLLQRLLRQSDTTTVLILRDPYNWLASSMRHSRLGLPELKDAKEKLKAYLRQATGRETYVRTGVVAVDYNRFVADPSYRMDLCERLGFVLRKEAEQGLRQIADFGGGSSFSGRSYEPGMDRSVSERWRHYIHDRDFLDILRDVELRSLSEEFFGRFPSYDELAERLWA